MHDSQSSSKITAKDIYKELWECRNFEISNLWQRSVFLTVFMVALAAGYGTLSLKLLTDFSTACDKVFPYAHYAAAGLSILGIIFSMLWIMMAKASKYWYERFEWSINYFVDQSEEISGCSESSIFDVKNITNCITREEFLAKKETRKKRDFPYHGWTGENSDNDCNILSTAGGKFSPSKINIFIGIVGLMTWSVLLIVHLFVIFTKNIKVNQISAGSFSVLCWGFIMLLLYFGISAITKSGR